MKPSPKTRMQPASFPIRWPLICSRGEEAVCGFSGVVSAVLIIVGSPWIHFTWNCLFVEVIYIWLHLSISSVQKKGVGVNFKRKLMGSLDSVFSILSVFGTLLTLRGSNPIGSKKFFYSPKRADWLWSPPNFPFNGHRVYFPGIKRQGTWNSPISSIYCRG